MKAQGNALGEKPYGFLPCKGVTTFDQFVLPFQGELALRVRSQGVALG